ncbi:DnaJ-class molecular chaperone [Actinoplanes octamycinicus]|uniref:DnaJ-class molecular chaperone n=1 Tax=Actinoplanes octamycinicus TaxID=135948 RepID=A0A7W7M7Z0_9ACTN|nr:DnaJ-class molecular chaperone [Actinoplanes octamycinicus]
MDCQKCHKRLHTCSSCKGQTSRSLLGDRLTCSTCQSTGSVCPDHGGHWKR